ncbi:MAG: DUF2256 domain-containing protein [Sphingomonadales bacterium]|nr:DUF2256 domain-containing protein [Sphingomonadales bacterium]MBM3936742.1 DUF2256 domain-containing protein [Sphingomonadales bacterium]
MATVYRKPFLPTKVCPSCGRSFAWRRKWILNWEQLRYCSKKCGSKSQ